VVSLRYVSEFIYQKIILFQFIILLLNGLVVSASSLHLLLGLAFLCGVLLFFVLEYLVHRFILHRFPKWIPKAYWGHVAHHQNPMDSKYLFGPLRYEIYGTTAVYLILWAITGNLYLASATFLGVSVGQIYYQWQHFVAHRPIVPITPWGKWIRKNHLLHHHQDENYWFGVSNPVLDMVFGTYSSIHRKNIDNGRSDDVSQHSNDI
jgi:4-hydroxysphinganine ceramide fatty acyl 2-hydroxylase